MSGQKPFVTNLKLNGKSEFGDINGVAQLLGVENGFAVRNIDINGAGVRALGSASFIEKSKPKRKFCNIGAKRLVFTKWRIVWKR